MLESLTTTANSLADEIPFNVPYDMWAMVSAEAIKQACVFSLKRKLGKAKYTSIYELPAGWRAGNLRNCVFLEEGEWVAGIPGGPVQGSFALKILGYDAKKITMTQMIAPMPPPETWPIARVADATSLAAGTITVPGTPPTIWFVKGLYFQNANQATAKTIQLYSGLDTGTIDLWYQASSTLPLMQYVNGLSLYSGDRVTMTAGTFTAADVMSRHVMVGRMVLSA